MVWTEGSGVVDLVRTENIARGPFGCLLALWLPAASMRSAGEWTAAAGLCVLCACTLSRCAAQLVDLWCHRASPQAEIVAVAAAVEDVKNLNIPSPTAAVVEATTSADERFGVGGNWIKVIGQSPREIELILLQLWFNNFETIVTKSRITKRTRPTSTGSQRSSYKRQTRIELSP